MLYNNETISCNVEKPILINLKLPINTPRLVLRYFLPGDGKVLYEALMETRDQLQEWFSWAHKPFSVEDAEEKVRQYHTNFLLRKSLNFAILNKDGGFLGLINLRDINWDIPSARTGYWCRKSAQGKGIMSEALVALTRYAFEFMKLKRLYLLCHHDNTRSISLIEHLKFNLEVEAKGLATKPGNHDLSLVRQYVRFDSLGLPDFPISW